MRDAAPGTGRPPAGSPGSVPHRLGLRTRILLTFTLGVAVLAIVLAFTTYGLTRSTLLRQRGGQRPATRPTATPGRCGPTLRANPASAPPPCEVVPDTGAVRALLRYRGEWTNRSPEFSADSLRPALQRAGDRGR